MSLQTHQNKKMDGKHVRAPNLKKTSLSTNVHLTMEVSQTFVITIDTFWFKNECKTNKG